MGTEEQSEPGPDRAAGPPDPPRPRGPVPRYRRRVTPTDVGRRVSVRHLVDDPDRGPVPTDVVGRLLSIDDELLLVVDRSETLHVVEAASVLASRVVPPHPRLPPEPDVGTEHAPLRRRAARAVLLDPDDRVLLVAHRPGANARVWTAPGGGLQPGEGHLDAVRRELREELGADIACGPWIWNRRVTIRFRGVWLDQTERWYLARVPHLDAATAPLADPGTDVARWWTLDELDATDEQLAPAALAGHLRALARDGVPDEPLDIGR